LWDNGVERAGDIAEAVQRLEGARGTIGSGLVDAAWSMELSTARATLASHGTGFFKIFSGDWRNANRLVRTVLTNPNQPLDETLSQLDALAEGQAARRAIENDETFARSAFGGDWRGDRSASTALFALVEWMRSLKGLGAEPRIVAAKRPDRDEIGMRLTRTEALLGEVLPVIDTLWCDLPSQEVIFGDALTAERADLSALLGTVSEFHAADQASTSVAVKVPTDLNLRLETLDDLAEGQRRAANISDNESLGQSAFDTSWRAHESAWAVLSSVADWIEKIATSVCWPVGSSTAKHWCRSPTRSKVTVRFLSPIPERCWVICSATLPSLLAIQIWQRCHSPSCASGLRSGLPTASNCPNG
jgi:hypothetical protein